MRTGLFRQRAAVAPRAVLRAGSAHRVRSRSRRLLMLLRCLALTMLGAQAYADSMLRHFDIQTQAAASALNEFARQADITLVFSSVLVAKHQAAGIHGDFTVIDGLRKLLDGTGLSFKQVSATTIAIRAASDAGDSPDPPPNAEDTKQAPAENETPIKGDTNMNHRGLLTRLASLFALSGALLAGGHAAYGQEPAAQAAPETAGQAGAPVDASAANTSTLEEVVVTGTAASGGLKKLDASFQITTASLAEIQDSSPSSSADLLKIVPSIWAESGGGEAGPNIELAGYPGGSGAPYVTYSINGSPVYPSHNLSFLDDSSMFRLDDTVERVEVVLGGPSVVFSDGQLGATANFILRQGTETPHGDIGVTVGSEGMYRLDGFYGGPISQDWYMSAGGFYRVSDGVRPSQYPADDGGQFTATLSHTMDQGSIMFYARVLNDKNLFIADIPLVATGSGKNVTYSAFPGFNPLTGWFAGSAIQGLSVQECPGCAPLTANLADGRGANLHTFGSDLDLDISDGIKLSNKLMYTGGDMPTIGIFTGGAPPVTMSSFITSAVTAANGNAPAVAAGGLATGGAATYVGGGAVNPNTYVMENGFWDVDKQLQSFTDDLRFTFEVVPGNNLTVGSYFAAYTSNDTWYLGNNELMTATPNAQLINLTLNNGAIVSNNGLASACTYCLVDRFQGLNAALFFSDQWRIEQWLLDAGYRIEEQKVDGTIENTTSTNLSTSPLSLYNQGVSVPNGTWKVANCETTLQLGNGAQCDEFEKIKGSWTVGGTYELSQHMSVYARADQGVHFPSFDDLRNGTPQTESIQNYEVGYRVQTDTIYADVDVFHRTFSGVPFQQYVTIGPTLVNLVFSYGVDSTGVDFVGRWQPIQHLSLGITGNWQDSTYTNIIAAGGAGADGNILQRQPRFQMRFTPEYDVPMGWGDVRFFATYSYIGLRYSDPGNAQVLPAYATLDGGIVADIGHFELRLQGTNLTNELGITEQDARAASGTSGSSGGFALGRPIFGREINLGLKYKF
jgi:outer membrane receptor protein involved in Fe transport